MKENIADELRELKTEVKDYIENRYEFTKLHITGEIARFFSGLFTRTIILYLLFFGLLFLSLALAIQLGEWWQSYPLGLVVVGVLYLLITLIFWFLRKRLIQRPVIRSIMTLMFPNFEDYENQE